MNSIKVCLLFLILITSFQVYSQNQFPDEVYEGGREGFRKDFSISVQYPKTARMSLYYTTAMVNLIVSPEGKLKQLEFLNQVGNGIDQELIRVLTSVTTKWKSFEASGDKSILLAITFTYEDDYSSVIGMKEQKPANVADELVITAKSSPPSAAPFDYKADYLSLKKQAYKYLEKGKDKEALNFFSQLLSINPYEEDFYNQRVKLSQRLNQDIYLCFDALALKRIFSIPSDSIQSKCPGSL